ncbi:MAG: hypothetical protein C4540_00045 [Candidatus Omnitrophota bacterium]|jgi:predicted nucleotidyltransferase|nr:MAG: hypothetical protein C4540_00045 [Candidatus Omnitrophota bacterium]
MDNLINQVENKINEDALLIVNRLKNNLEALILVGSFARGEGVAFQNNGELVLLSDIEFLAVVKNIQKARQKTSVLPLNDKLSLGFAIKKSLKRLKPYIFTVETKKFGKVIWGDPAILNLIPDYPYESIDPLDGFVLLNNRIVEQLILLKKIVDGETISQYYFEKGYVQLANALLAVRKKYRSLYYEKEKELINLANIDKEIVSKIRLAFGIINKKEFRNFTKDEAKASWHQLMEYTKEICLKEKRNCLKKEGGILKEEIKEIGKIGGIVDSVKGWVKVISVKCKRMQFSKKELFLNFLRNSPQSLIYQDAVALYFANKHDKNRLDQVITRWESVVK